MIHKVKKIAKNPLEAAQEEENQALASEKVIEEEKRKNKGKGKKKKIKEAPFETVILENTKGKEKRRQEKRQGVNKCNKKKV